MYYYKYFKKQFYFQVSINDPFHNFLTQIMYQNQMSPPSKKKGTILRTLYKHSRNIYCLMNGIDVEDYHIQLWYNNAYTQWIVSFILTCLVFLSISTYVASTLRVVK